MLTLDPVDLQPISALFEEHLTTAEMERIANDPLRTPRLLRIKDDAKSTASKAHQRDDQVPQDAYRHVLWSCLLIVILILQHPHWWDTAYCC